MAKTEDVKGWSELTKGEQEIIKRKLLGQENGSPAAKVGGKGKSSFNLRGYLRCELSADDKEHFRGWEADNGGAAAFEALVKAVDSGYLLKVGESGQGYQASLCAATTGKEWDGYVLTAHAASGQRAAALLVFKHGVLMQGNWSAWLTEEGDDFFR
jgi:hypothetical protein